jgi:PPOX class probable F420-dependent enzyme
MAAIPASHRNILESRSFAHVATVMRDGTVQVTPVWIDVDGDEIVFNTAEGRIKDRNLRRNPHVALSATDPENPYRYIQVRGEVVARTTEGADAHIDRMARKYLGLESYPYRNAAEKRVIYRIRPTSVQTMG